MKKIKNDNWSIYLPLLIGTFLAKLFVNFALPALGLDIENVNYVAELLISLGIIIAFYIPTRYAFIKVFKLRE